MSKWKPTDEMIQTGATLLRHWFGATTHFPAEEAAKFLIAVQPLIAAEALAMEKDRFYVELSDIRKHQQQMEIAEATAPLQAELEASLKEIASLRADLAEEGAKALKEAAQRVWMFASDGRFADSHDTELCNHLATTILALIPKPPEGT